MYLQESNDVPTSIKNIQKELDQLHETYQLKLKHPFVVIYGQQLTEITCAYIIVGEHIYQVQSSTGTVNICYQLTKVLFKDFSLINNHVWKFIEREVFQFSDVKIIGNVCKVIEELQRF